MLDYVYTSKNLYLKTIQKHHYNCLKKEGKQNMGKELVKAKITFKNLTDEERVEIMSDYCRSCGSDNPRCQCWNDE